MSINFFETDCREPSRSNLLFGICDDQDGKKAYTDAVDKERWIATVINKKQISISFTAIDNCLIVLKDGTKDQESSCDGMLVYSDSIILVELKKQGTGGWLPDAKKQLENTIRLLGTSSNLNNYRYKKAYACNKRHPKFMVIEASEKKAFFERTNGFRIDVQAEILIK